MSYDFTKFKNAGRETGEWLAREFATLRTGRANPSILDGVFVEAWGARVPIKQTASIAVEDARALRVVPYDAEQAKAIEKAIASANLGLSVAAGEGGIRVIFPELSAERRALLLKAAKAKLEEARVSLRRARDAELHALLAGEKAGKVGKDEAFRVKKELDKLTAEENQKYDDALARKETEINS